MQTVMKVVLLTLVHRHRPFFSCEEVWQTTRKKLMSVFPNLEERVHLSSFTPEDQALLRQAPTLVAWRTQVVTGALGQARAEKKIWSSLGGWPTVYAHPTMETDLSSDLLEELS